MKKYSIEQIKKIISGAEKVEIEVPFQKPVILVVDGVRIPVPVKSKQELMDTLCEEAIR